MSTRLRLPVAAALVVLAIVGTTWLTQGPSDWDQAKIGESNGYTIGLIEEGTRWGPAVHRCIEECPVPLELVLGLRIVDERHACLIVTDLSGQEPEAVGMLSSHTDVWAEAGDSVALTNGEFRIVEGDQVKFSDGELSWSYVDSSPYGDDADAVAGFRNYARTCGVHGWLRLTLENESVPE